MPNDGRSKSVIRDGKWRSRYPVFTDGRKTRVSATKTPRNPNRTGWENGELRDPRNPQNSWEGGFPLRSEGTRLNSSHEWGTTARLCGYLVGLLWAVCDRSSC